MHPDPYLRIYLLKERALEHELQLRLAAASRPDGRRPTRAPRHRTGHLSRRRHG